MSPQALVLSPWERAEPTADVLARGRWLGRALIGLAVLAGLRWLWRSAWDERAFWLAALGGIVLSAPVVYGDAGLRGLGASFTFLSGLLAIGLGRGPRRPPGVAPVEARTRRVLAVAAAALVGIALAGPALAHATVRKPDAIALAAVPPETLVVRLRAAPAVVVSNRPRPDMHVPVLPRRQYLRHVGLANVAGSGFDRPDPPFAVVSAYDHVARRQRVLIVPPEALLDGRYLRVTARPVAEDENLQLASEWAPLP